ncbi:MAG: protein kinase [Waddliaceae bacterium]
MNINNIPPYNPQNENDNERDSKRIYYGGREFKEMSVAYITFNKNQSVFSNFFKKIKLKRYVKLENNTFVNINSLSKRLNISKKAIIHAKKRGGIQQLIEKVDTEEIKKVIYIKREFEIQTGITFKFKNSEIIDIFQKVIESKVGHRLRLEDNARFYISQKNGEISIHNISKIKDEDLRTINKLGRGSFGTAYKVKNIVTGAFEAYKLAFDDSKAENEIEVERKNLMRLHDALGEQIIGLQDKPSVILEYGYIGKLYDGDLSDCLREKNKTFSSGSDLLNVSQQLLSGLSSMHSMNLVHGDIKTSNVLVDKAAKTVHIADLGGARFTDELSFGNFTHTPTITSIKDQLYFEELIDQIKAEGTGKDEYVKLRKAHDVFSMGCVLYKVFTGSPLPYAKRKHQMYNKPHDFIDVEKSFFKGALQDKLKSLAESDDSFTVEKQNQITDLIESMLDPDWDRRPSAEEANLAIQHLLESEIKSADSEIDNSLGSEIKSADSEIDNSLVSEIKSVDHEADLE